MSYFWLDKCVTPEVTVVADEGNPKLKIKGFIFNNGVLFWGCGLEE